MSRFNSKPPSRPHAAIDRQFGRRPASQWSKSDLRVEQQDLVAEYLAKGGAITKGDAGRRSDQLIGVSKPRDGDQEPE
jgi:hypothetical protein